MDDEPELYTPEVWRSRPEGSVKQGSGDAVINNIDWGMNDNADIKHVYNSHCNYARNLYESMVEQGVAPEQARMVLPQSMYTSYYVTGSLAAFARAYTQRIDSSAQVEIQELARSWDDIISELYPESWAALTREEDWG